ncbi:PhzF family phenazine biosynthesis protein [Dactylosporangium salmoneum]|uniref:PhzF family phenazine biosynthesis protein n=1 Tax=Dactylosporangium salmoneum TaxID=53361 RepID=A0ABP5UFD7_9ACTN
MTPTIVRACLRDGRGGSPTAVLDDGPFDDAERRAVPPRAGTSHAVYLGEGPRLRFFTATGELPACGHGTVAALAVLAARAPHGRVALTLRAGPRAFHGRAERNGDEYEAWFDPGPVTLRAPRPAEAAPILAALGLTAAGLADGPCVAGVGRERLLVPVPGRATLAALAPDLTALRAACDTAGMLGCYVYSAPDARGRAAARMFAPSIGVPEDIANANSTACLAARLAGDGIGSVAVDMGDALGEPATIRASAHAGAIEVGGAARPV